MDYATIDKSGKIVRIYNNPNVAERVTKNVFGDGFKVSKLTSFGAEKSVIREIGKDASYE